MLTMAAGPRVGLLRHFSGRWRRVFRPDRRREYLACADPAQVNDGSANKCEIPPKSTLRKVRPMARSDAMGHFWTGAFGIFHQFKGPVHSGPAFKKIPGPFPICDFRSVPPRNDRDRISRFSSRSSGHTAHQRRSGSIRKLIFRIGRFPDPGPKAGALRKPASNFPEESFS